MQGLRVDDFEVLRWLGGGSNGGVVLVRCVKVGHPFPEKLYALKMVYNLFGLNTNAVISQYEAEFLLLARLAPHRRIVRFWYAPSFSCHDCS